MGDLPELDVYIFGAGASAAEGAPAIKDLFTQAWERLGPFFDERICRVWIFLEEIFEVEIDGPNAFAFIPTIDEVFSLVDWSLHVGQGLGRSYDPPRLYQIKRDLEYLLCATLETATAAMTKLHEGPHARFVSRVLRAPGPEQVAFLSLNYDTLLDHALARAGCEPNYGFGSLNLAGGRAPLLAKLHGSLNWGRCHVCDHIQVISRRLSEPESIEGGNCVRCGSHPLHRVVITPTWLKRYPSTQLRHVWDLAFEALRGARRILFIGYSMPPADLAFHHLLRRALLTRRGNRPQVKVVNHGARLGSAVEEAREEALRGRFMQLFGADVAFDFSGFQGIY